MEEKATASPKTPGFRKIFSVNEEEIIGKFLISCWKKKLRVPNEVLFQALQKHLEKYPRPTKCKDNKPSTIWRMKFFERNQPVQDAYAVYKASANKNFDLVSDQLVVSFLQDLALAEMPTTVTMPSSNIFQQKAELRDEASEFVQSTHDKADIKRGILNLDKKTSKAHKRSKTTGSAKPVQGVHAGLGSPKGPGNEAAKLKEKRRSVGALKLSPALFAAGKQASKPVSDETGVNNKQTDSKKAKLVKKASTESPATSKGRQVIPSDAVPLGPVKFEEGANIEAMDCGKWYRAKILEVDNDKKEVLVHFNGWGKRFDTIFPMTSALIRGVTQVDKKQEAIKFKVGDDVLSQWSDGNFYPGTVMALRGSGSYVVMFYDGLKKLVRPGMLKPITEKEKEASLKAAQKAYLMSLESKPVEEQPKPAAAAAAAVPSFRRYRTSATDRGKRISARSSDDSSTPSAPPIKRTRKRKFTEASTEDATGSSAAAESGSPSTSTNGSPKQPEKFQAKKARLDKITDTLLDKVTVVSTITTSSSTVTSSVGEKGTTATSSAKILMATDLVDVPSPQNNDVTFTYDSDGSDAPLVIDEDREGKIPKLTIKKGLVKTKQATKPAYRKKSLQTKETLADSKQAPETKLKRTAQKPDDPEKLSEASPAVKDESNVPSASPPTSGKERKEAGEALLQLSLSSFTTDKTSSDEQKSDKPTPMSPNKRSTELSESEKLDVAVGRVLKSGLNLVEAAEQMEVNVAQLRERILQRPGIISGSSTPQFMSAHEEDDIINWIHDVTDLGWGISDVHIRHRVKVFLAEHSYSVVFNNTSPINYPSTTWLSEFLDRHPEIFPGRKRPLSRFRCDREGFEDWLVRWLAMLKSYDIFPNAIYYCDELLWDASPKLLHDVKFKHAGTVLEMAAQKSKISSLSCFGANGDVLPTFHVFPENISGEMESDEKLGSVAAICNSGTLTSDLFCHWLKNNFLRNATLRRPLALLVDWRLDEVNYDVLQLAEENQIVLFRFLPPAAHFLQHPDQKLFGRLRQQWKKSLVSSFMKLNSSKERTTEDFAKFFDAQFRQVATSSTVKMCFELTKLYTPVLESKISESRRESKASKDKRNKRKRSKPVAYVDAEAQKGEVETEKVVEKEVVPATKDDVGQMDAVPAVNEEKSDGVNVSNVTNISPAPVPTEIPAKKETNKDSGIAPHASSIPLKKGSYKKGETVLAKWSDCRLYLATVLKRIDEDRYKIRYFDGLVKTVKDDFLRPWTGAMPVLPPVPKPDSTKHKKSPEQMKPAKLQRESKYRNIKPKEKPAKRQRTTSGTKRSSTSASSNKSPVITTTSTQSAFTPTDERITYKKGETVLCRWTDRRMYPATVIRQTDTDHYLVKYYDERKKIVKYTWLSPWKPVTQQQATSLPVASDVVGEEASKPVSPEVSKEQAIKGKTPTIVIAKLKVPESCAISFAAEKLEAKTAQAEQREKAERSEKGKAMEQLTDDKPVTSDGEKEAEKSTTPDVYGFKIGDTVLSRWTDCRSYPATILRKYNDGKYEVQYYDGMKRKVKASFLQIWNPNAFPQPLARPRKKTTSTDQAEEGKRTVSDRSSFSESSDSAQQQATGKTQLGLAHGHIPKSPFHKEFVVESELNKFRCRVPGCNKVFRKESVLQQHHRHYHLQRYKLRDQDAPAPTKRKASKDEPPAIKRRVSADYYSTMSPRPDTALSSDGDRGSRSRGGKPPIDRMKMTSLQVDSSTDDRSMTSPNQSANTSVDIHAVEKISPQSKLKRKRSDNIPSSVTQSSAEQTKETGDAESGGWSHSEDNEVSEETDTDVKGSVEVVNEDIIQCVCGDEEEEGFMIQCESCLTWQHAVCEGISPPPGTDSTQSGVKLPQGYVCSTCKNPPGVRRSQQYLYNNDFLTKGKLPSLVNLEGELEAAGSNKDKMFDQIILVTNRLMNEVTKLQESLHGVRLKIDIADPEKNHPLLRLWKQTSDDTTAEKRKSDVTNNADAIPSDSAEKENDNISEAVKVCEQASDETNDGATSGTGVGVSMFRTVKSVLMQIVRSVTSSTSPARDIREGEAESNGVKDSMEVDESENSSGNKESPDVERNVEETGKKNISAKSEEKQNSDIWKPIEIERAVVALSEMSKKEQEADERVEEVVKSRANLLSLINHLEDSLAERLVKLTDYVSTVETAFERCVASPTSSTDQTAPSVDNRQLGELQSDIGLIHNSLEAVHKLLASNV
uniref:Uncharacterized protein zf(C2h2)-137 n=1 Tax=Phallusia mammillata TaxID=59560 RepID=A0A6F9DP70_9ASCI|nr:uncharacterized protein zf(c2h2)-137 [Phallusia mammillata]